jgi:hypothetical protein
MMLNLDVCQVAVLDRAEEETNKLKNIISNWHNEHMPLSARVLLLTGSSFTVMTCFILQVGAAGF